MAEDEFTPELDEAVAEPAATAVGLALSAAEKDANVASEARAFLRKQSAMLDYQIQNMREVEKLQVSHLRWRRFNDQMRGALQILALVVGTVVAVGLGALLWNAHQARGLVVEPLRTPPDFAAKGLDGTVLAERLLDKLNALVAESESTSYRSADAIGGDWGEDSKVAIPETGVSIGELSRLLRAWLGNETHASGEIWRTQAGIALNVRAGSNAGVTVLGSEADLDKLLDQAAEKLLAQTQPYRYAAVLQQRGRLDDAIAFVTPIARSGAPEDQPWAYTSWSNALTFMGRNREALEPATESIRLDPSDPSSYFVRGGQNLFLGHFEPVVNDVNTVDRLRGGPGVSKVSRTAAAAIFPLVEEVNCRLLGDFSCAIAKTQEIEKVAFVGFEYSELLEATNSVLQHDISRARELIARHPQWSDVTGVMATDYTDLEMPRFFIAADDGDWHAAIADLEDADSKNASVAIAQDVRHTFVWPWLAYALAKAGRDRDSQALITKTALDCDPCVEMRGRIAAAEGRTGAAAYWFARTIHQAPSIPFAYTDWGEMLLHHGDHDGAIEKFEHAHQKGPHFADPLELWGEALMLKNRSDLALAKFEEANKYAPHWGRLHLKWGEALLYDGHKAEARAQFQAASAMDLSAADREMVSRELTGLHV